MLGMNTSQQERWRPNVTVAAIIEKDGKFLLVEERTRDGLKLNNPAGHLDPHESPVQGCARETLEETAHHFQPSALVGIYMSRFQRPATASTPFEDITYLRFAFCGELGAYAPEREAGMAEEGIVRTLWMSPDEIRASVDNHRSPLVLRCMEDYLTGQRWPLGMLYTDASVYGLD
jgi:8-oxo-dGTP pyrophosphatase MutT (NUDIX family)